MKASSLSAAILLCLSAACAAQPAEPAAPATSPGPSPAAAPGPAPAGAPDKETIDYIARAVARIALMDLRVTQQLNLSDYLAAADMLTIAHELIPLDEEILRLVMEAELQAGRADRLEALTRELVKIDPADTVAQLSLITGRVLKLQSADDRLDALSGLLGPKGEGLDPSVRSRLALDAALLLREKGDAQGFSARLREAMRLDSTNRDAATLLVALVNSGDAPPASRLESLILLLNADPIDQDTHEAIAAELARAGALKEAVRFLDNADALAQAFSGDRSSGVAASRMLTQWRALGPAKPLELINQLIVIRRSEAQNLIDRAKAAGEDAANIPKPEMFRVPPQVERVWLLAAQDAGDMALRDLALVEIDRTLERATANLADPERRATIGEETARAELETVQADGVWLRVLIGEQLPRAEQVLTELRTNPRTGGPGLRRLDAWLGLRKATPENRAAFEEELEALAPTDPLADLGMAVACELKGDKAQAAKRFARCATQLSGTLEGGFAERRHLALTRTLPPAPPEAAELAAMATGIPRWIDEIARDPRRFMQLTATLTADSVRPTDRVGLHVRLRNTSPMNLAVGAEKTINTRFLLSPQSDVGSHPFRSGVPEFASLERRLRLKPREELAVALWPDGGYGSWYLELYAGELIRQRWRVVQGFRLTNNGVPDAGPMSLSTETQGLIRRPFTDAKADIASLASRVGTAERTALIDALGALRWRLFRDELTMQIFTPEEGKAALDALLLRYRQASPLERLLVLATMPTGTFFKRLAPFDAALAAVPESDDRVATFKVYTRATDPADPFIAAAKASPSAAVRDAAAIAARRLAPNRIIYARARSAAPPPQNEGGVDSGGEAKPGGDTAKPELPKPDTSPPTTPLPASPVPK